MKAADPRETSQLLPLMYGELRVLAGVLLRRKAPGQTLQATALVHEAYAKLVCDGEPDWHGRPHFFAAAARAMRNILVDEARRKAAVKRGGNHRRVDADLEDLVADVPGDDVLALNEALTKLEAEDARKAQIVMLKFFAGLSIPEIAEELEVSASTIEREWRFTRAWLYRELDMQRG